MNMFRSAGMASLFLLLSAFQPGEPTPASGVSGVLKEYMDASVKPGDDFFRYVNGSWVANTEIPADKSTYGIAYMLYEKSQEDVRQIIEESAAAQQPKGSDEQKVGALFASYMDLDGRDALGYQPLQADLARIEALEDHADLPAYFAYANRMGYGKPFSMSVLVDFKDPTQYVLYTWQSGLGLPNRDYYLNEDEASVAIRAAYVEHIGKVLNLAGIATTPQTAADIMALETRMAQAHMKKEDTRDRAAMYNPYAVADLGQLYPGFDWAGFLEAAGVPEAGRVIISQVDYVKALATIVPETDMATWKAYLTWHL
ncbi:MAG: peptidase M13, partial [Bacteroidetes bacterium]